jgi:ribosomal protein S18 acetylase RimI-like enzyme
MGAAMTTRRLAPPDAAAYRELMLQAYARHPDAFTASVEERGGLPLAWWEARVQPGEAAAEMVVGAFGGAGLLGVAGLSFESRPKLRHKAHLFGMYVAPEARGQGLGEQLVRAVLAQAASRPGVRLVQLTVSEGNAAAEALYARCGFTRFGVEPHAMAHGDGFIAKVHMWCALAPRAGFAAGGPAGPPPSGNAPRPS